MSNKDWNESLGAAIENAAGSLPEGYILQLSIENGGYGLKLVGNGKEHTTEQESMADELEWLTARAVEIENEKK